MVFRYRHTNNKRHSLTDWLPLVIPSNEGTQPDSQTARQAGHTDRSHMYVSMQGGQARRSDTTKKDLSIYRSLHQCTHTRTHERTYMHIRRSVSHSHVTSLSAVGLSVCK